MIISGALYTDKGLWMAGTGDPRAIAVINTKHAGLQVRVTDTKRAIGVFLALYAKSVFFIAL
jgi:hypothetical protein